MIKLELTIDQINALLNALSPLPYAQVHELIKLILEQGNPQAQAIMDAKKVEESEKKED